MHESERGQPSPEEIKDLIDGFKAAPFENFDALENALDALAMNGVEPVEGTRGSYAFSQLKEQVEEARTTFEAAASAAFELNDKTIDGYANLVTRAPALGLRDKVKAIMKQEAALYEENVAALREQLGTLLMTESTSMGTVTDAGGKKYTCSGADFYANSQTGEIVELGRPQDVASEIKENPDNALGMFRVIINPKREGPPDGTIVEVMQADAFSPAATRKLGVTMERWNNLRKIDEARKK
jgi:hypothetical protein